MCERVDGRIIPRGFNGGEREWTLDVGCRLHMYLLVQIQGGFRVLEIEFVSVSVCECVPGAGLEGGGRM